MANPLGIVARLTRPLRDTASDYFEKFDSFMKQGNIESVLSNFQSFNSQKKGLNVPFYYIATLSIDRLT